MDGVLLTGMLQVTGLQVRGQSAIDIRKTQTFQPSISFSQTIPTLTSPQR